MRENNKKNKKKIQVWKHQLKKNVKEVALKNRDD